MMHTLSISTHWMAMLQNGKQGYVGPIWDCCSKKQKVTIVASIVSKKSQIMEFKDIQDNLRNMEDKRYSSYQRRSNDDSDVFHYTCIMVFQ